MRSTATRSTSGNADSLYVNLFIPSELNWREKNVRVTQVTRFPDEPVTRLTVHVARPTKFALRVRHPSWCAAATVAVNGRGTVASRSAGSYIALDRTWRDGDTVEVRLPMALSLQPLPNTAGIAALMYGPLVLAGRLGTEGLTPGADIIVNERKSGEMLDKPIALPRLAVNASTVAQRVRRNASDNVSFSARGGEPEREIELVPYHRIAHERYTLYWNVG